MIDSHFHCWQLARGDYGWLTPAMGSIHRDVSVKDWQMESAAHGITGGVLVQAAPTKAETLFLLDQARANPAVLGVVGWVDLLAADAPEQIAGLAQSPKLKGLRPMLQDIADPDWILQPALAPALRAMSELGLVFDALVKPEHLPRILTLAQRFPALRLVIDHAAKPDIAAGKWQPWADDLARIAQQTEATCKLSGLLTEAGPSPAASAVRRWGQHVLDVFGEGRVMWGSDWPVLELAGTYADWFTEARAMAASLGESARQQVFGATAERVYRL
ncbi:MAG: amidohydrolase family protein [Pseudomonadota bacterium]